MLAVTFEQPGDASVLQFSDVPKPIPNEEQLLVKVHATALNRADISQRRGSYPAPPGHSAVLGLEMAGEVVAIGNKVKNFKIGDRVFGLVDGGGYAEYCLLDHGMAIPIPEKWNYLQAAAIAEAFLTAQVCLIPLGELKAGEAILIHAGGSGVGTAAIQIAKQIGATVFITAGSEEKIKKCLALGADVGINYKTQDFFRVIKEITGGNGVNVILDPVGEKYFQLNLDLLAKEGRLIQIAKMSGDKAEFSLGRLTVKRLQIKGNSMRSRSLEDKRQITQTFIRDWLPLLINEKMLPIIDKVFPFKEVQAAHQYMESNQNFGKVILQLSH